MRRGGRPTDDGATGDPLAELARLIGQSDPFSDYGRRDGRDSAPRNAQSKAPAADWRRTAAAMPPYDAPEEPRRASRSEPRFTDSGFDQDSRQDLRQDPHRDSYRQDPYRMAEEPLDPRLDTRYDERLDERPSQYRREPQFADDDYHPREDERMYGARDQGSTYYEDDAPLSAQEEDSYDDPPRPRRRGGLLTAVTLIGCAMIGTAGAYGYRTYYAAPSASRVPPVISAETSPTKVVSAAEGPTGKFIQDRVRDVAPPERVVSREEEPVEIKTPSAPPRVVLPSPSQSGGFPPPSSSGGATSGATAGANGASSYAPPAGGSGTTPDAKRVRTVTIKPDGQSGGGSSPSAAAATTPSRPAPAAKAAPRGPISLDPQESSAPPPPAPRERVAAASPPATTQSIQPRATAVPSDASSGGYAVQLSSQKSEAEAQASFKALQAKFPDQLSDRTATIKRVDLGSKGIYFRALVGPFASLDEAASFCTDLKAAGGQCLIPRN
jgi:SPOR domain